MIRLLILVALAASPALADADEVVRVRLLDRERPSTASFQAEGGAAALYVDGRLVATLTAGQTVAIEASSGRIAVQAQGTRASGSSAVLEPAGGALLRLRAANRNRTYRGFITVTGSGRQLEIVNNVSLDDYIASVIPSEYPFPEIEGVKAQAVLVRTYALRSRGRFGTYDVVDHVGSQVYHGVTSETPLARRAAELTRGEVVTFNGELIEAVYFSSSGGHTADNESIWDGTPKPYLRGRPDPYDSASPLHRWSESVDRDRVLSALSRAYGFQVTGFAIAGTSAEGRVTRIRLIGSRERIEQANRFRLTLNDAIGRQVLKSTYFTVEGRGNRYVFSGRGFGHGVGMSQYGAREKARQGRTYTEILAFYYSGVALEQRLSGQRPALLADHPEIGPIEPLPARPVSSESTRRRTARTGW